MRSPQAARTLRRSLMPLAGWLGRPSRHGERFVRAGRQAPLGAALPLCTAGTGPPRQDRHSPRCSAAALGATGGTRMDTEGHGTARAADSGVTAGRAALTCGSAGSRCGGCQVCPQQCPRHTEPSGDSSRSRHAAMPRARDPCPAAAARGGRGAVLYPWLLGEPAAICPRYREALSYAGRASTRSAWAAVRPGRASTAGPSGSPLTRFPSRAQLRSSSTLTNSFSHRDRITGTPSSAYGFLLWFACISASLLMPQSFFSRGCKSKLMV